MEEQKTTDDSKLIPVLREGIECVKMIFFRNLQTMLAAKFPGRDKMYRNKLAGAVINRYFGMFNPDPAFADFARQEEAVIDEVLLTVASELAALRIPLTDALRTMVICDHQEGVENSAVLARAKEYGILLADRDLPMPNRFIELVRRLSSAKGMVTEPVPDTDPQQHKQEAAAK
ncbi:MAG: hypothetical protein GXP59_05575 [Deltaproteobacteria bacterium]|nr:hypothetical protein [Deltaproteobacteria bacterium]